MYHMVGYTRVNPRVAFRPDVTTNAEIRIEDLIAEEDVVITVTHTGYLKRTPLTVYRNQGRGGKAKGKGAGPDEPSGRVQQRMERTFGAITHSEQATPSARLSPFQSFGG